MDIPSNFKFCEFCGKPLPLSYKETYCPNCKENMLFREVKEYIRNNIVNEYQVADHFDIPLRMVKNWIREGRIEYREVPAGQAAIASLHCMRCGAPVTFGTMCAKCLKLLNSGMHGYDSGKPMDDSKIRYLDVDHIKNI